MTVPTSAAESTAAANACCADLLREAAEWRLVGLLLACPVGDWRAQIESLAGEIGDHELREAAQAAQTEADEGLYHTTFGPGGPAAPREVSYQRSALSGQYLAELSAYYDAFGYRPPGDEPPDHVAVEVDFIAYLRLKQAYAVQRRDETQAAVTAEAAQRFLADHLWAIAAPLAKTVAASGTRYLTLAAAALLRRAGGPPSAADGALPAWNATVGMELPLCVVENCCGELLDD